MKTFRFLAATALACVAAVNLSGCALLNAKPSDLAPTIDALARAGCTGDLTFTAGAGSAAGLSPGSFHAENSFHGSCDPRNAPPAVKPLSQLDVSDLNPAPGFGGGGASGAFEQ